MSVQRIDKQRKNKKILLGGKSVYLTEFIIWYCDSIYDLCIRYWELSVIQVCKSSIIYILLFQSEYVNLTAVLCDGWTERKFLKEN